MDQEKNNTQGNKSESRRKFLLTAAKVAPVITTIASKPVWATNVSISGNLSGNQSGQYEVADYNGCSPGYYKNKLPRRELNKTFGNVFKNPVTGHFNPYFNEFKNVKVGTILHSSSDGRKLARYLLSAHYNASDSGYSGNRFNYPYKVAEIQEFSENISDLGLPGTVSGAEATSILTMLIHNGNEDATWEQEQNGEC